MTKRITATLLTTLVLLLGGCVNEVDREVDCANICAAYQDCLPGDQNEADCRDRCDDASFGDVDECDTCIDSMPACTDCTVECAEPLAGA